MSIALGARYVASGAFFISKKSQEFFACENRGHDNALYNEENGKGGRDMSRVVERRIELLQYLCKVRHEKRTNLMFKFEVSSATLDADIRALSYSYPIYTVRGPNGGVFVSDGFYLGQHYLSSEQAKFLESVMERLDDADSKKMKSILDEFKRPQPNHRKG